MSTKSSGDLLDKLLRSGTHTPASSTPRGHKYEAMLAETASQATSMLLNPQGDQTHSRELMPANTWQKQGRSLRLEPSSQQRPHLPAKVVFLRWWLDTFGYSKPLRTAWEDKTYCSPLLSATESYQKSDQQSPTFIRGVCMSRDTSAESVPPVLQQDTEPSTSISGLSQSYNGSSHTSRWLSVTDSHRPLLKLDPTGPSMAAIDQNLQPCLVAAGQSSEIAQGSKARQGKNSFPQEGGRIDSSSPPKTTQRCGQDLNASSNVFIAPTELCQPCDQDSLSRVKGDYTQDINFLCSFARQNQAWAEGNVTHRHYYSNQISGTQPNDGGPLNDDTLINKEQELTACIKQQNYKGKPTLHPCNLSTEAGYCQTQEHNDKNKLSNLTASVTQTEQTTDACHNKDAQNLICESKLTSSNLSFPLRNYNSIQLEKSTLLSNEMRKCKCLCNDLKYHNNSHGGEENSGSQSNMSYFRQLAAKRSRKDGNNNQQATPMNQESFYAENLKVAHATSNKDQVKSEAACLPTNIEQVKFLGIQTTALTPQFHQQTMKPSVTSNISFPGSNSNHELGKCNKSHAKTEERCMMGMVVPSDTFQTASRKEVTNQEGTRKHEVEENVNICQESSYCNDSEQFLELQHNYHSCNLSMTSRSYTYLTPRKTTAYRSVMQQRSQCEIGSVLPQRSQSDFRFGLTQKSQCDISLTTKMDGHDRKVKLNISRNFNYSLLSKALSEDLYLTTDCKKEHYINTYMNIQWCESFLHLVKNETTSVMHGLDTPVIGDIQNVLKQSHTEGLPAENVLQENVLKQIHEECPTDGNVLQQNADIDFQNVRGPEDDPAASTQSKLNKYNDKSSPAQSELNKHNVKCTEAQYLPRQNNETVSPETVQLDNDRKTTQDPDALNQYTNKMSLTWEEWTPRYHKASLAHIVQQETNDKVSLVTNVGTQNKERSQTAQSVQEQTTGKTLQTQYSHRYTNNDSAIAVPNVQPPQINESSIDKKEQKHIDDKNLLVPNAQNQNNAETLLIQKLCENNYKSPPVQNAQPPASRIKCSRAVIESQLKALLAGSRLKTCLQEAAHGVSKSLLPNEDFPKMSKSNHQLRSSINKNYKNDGILISNNKSTKSSPEQSVTISQPNRYNEIIEQKLVNRTSEYDKLGSMKVPECPGGQRDPDFSLETLALQKRKASSLSDASENTADLSEVRSSPSPPRRTIRKKNPVFPRPRPNALGFTDAEKQNQLSRSLSYQSTDIHTLECLVSISRKHSHKQANLKTNLKRKLRLFENVPLCQQSKGHYSKSGSIPVPHRTSHEGSLSKAALLKVLPPLESLLAIQENKLTKSVASSDDQEKNDPEAKLAQQTYFGAACKSQNDVELMTLEDPHKVQRFILANAQTSLSLPQKCDRLKIPFNEPTFKIHQRSSSPHWNSATPSINTLQANHSCNLQPFNLKEDNTWDNSREESSLEVFRTSLPVDGSFAEPSCSNRCAGKRFPGLLPGILNMERCVLSRKFDGEILDTTLAATSNEDSRELLQSKHEMSIKHRTSGAVRSKGERGSSMMIEDIEHSTTGDSTQLRGQELEGKFTKKARRLGKKMSIKEKTTHTPPMTFLNMLLSDELKLDELDI